MARLESDSGPATAPGELTRLLTRWQEGDAAAEQQLFERVYPRLKRLAAEQLLRSPGRLTLCATELAHESFLKLVGLRHLGYQDRRHFFAVAARAMRQLVIDLLRRKGAAKRGGGLPFVDLDAWRAQQIPVDGSIDWLAVDEALTELERLDPAAARIVELKFFSGLTTDEIAAVVGCSAPTVKRRWRFARSWLAHRLRPVAGRA